VPVAVDLGDSVVGVVVAALVLLVVAIGLRVRLARSR
jgi:hypothetical protein